LFTEDDLLPISALQHLLFCERQCALIHVERLWVENRLTVEGRLLHDKAHAGPDESRRGVRVVRQLPLRSLRLGLVGVADVVEFQPSEHGVAETNSLHTPQSGNTQRAPPDTPFPVEYKRGKPKTADCDRVQLCAQAMCLEEMLGVSVPAGALFYGRTRRREQVAFDAGLRALTEQTAARLHELISLGRTPVAVRMPKCRNCSLAQLCLPEPAKGSRSAARYLQRALRQSETPSEAGED
jgi:CRISPR-associated exonuclease Cas4